LLLLARLRRRSPLLLQTVACWRLLLHHLQLPLLDQLLHLRLMRAAVCEASSLTFCRCAGAVSCVHAPAQLSAAAPGCLPVAVALMADRNLLHLLKHLL
jgi:hypothetical protein